MALAEQLLPYPEKEVLHFANIELIYPNESMSDPESGEHDIRFGVIAAVLNPPLNNRTIIGIEFIIGDYKVKIESLELKYENTYAGSIIARFKLLAVVLVGTCQTVAIYPSIKEAIPILIGDISNVINSVIENAPDRDNLPNNMNEYQILFRNEEEILLEIERNRRN